MALILEGVAVLSRIMEGEGGEDCGGGGGQELKAVLAKHGMIDTLLSVLKSCRLPDDAKKTLLPVVINRITALLTGCQVASDRMANKNG